LLFIVIGFGVDITLTVAPAFGILSKTLQNSIYPAR